LDCLDEEKMIIKIQAEISLQLFQFSLLFFYQIFFSKNMIPMEYFCMTKHCDIAEQMLLKLNNFCLFVPAAVRKITSTTLVNVKHHL